MRYLQAANAACPSMACRHVPPSQLMLHLQVLIVFGVGGGFGVVGGGMIGQALYNRRKHLMPIFVGISVMLATFPMLWLVNARVREWPLFCTYAAAFVGGMLASPPGPNAR